MASGSKQLLEGLITKDRKQVFSNQIKQTVNTVNSRVPDCYLNTQTGKKSTAVSLPETVLAVACGGGTFIDYEMVRGLKVIYVADHIKTPQQGLSVFGL